ncbi:MAG TPA: RNA polymerase sigma factor [Solirubrobacteraceae bacterium]|jgi:RNA polymerase sigma-70 factor (ECF subfamily)
MVGEGDDSNAITASLARPEYFAAIFDRHFGTVHRYLARRVGGERAEDLAAATFVIAFERRRSFSSDALSARPWLLGIATNLIHERHRDDTREQATRIRLAAERSPGDADGFDDKAAAVLAEALAGLDSKQRDVLLLYAWADLSYENIALALDVPVGTVRSRLSRARRHVRERLRSEQDVQQLTQGGTPDDR